MKQILLFILFFTCFTVSKTSAQSIKKYNESSSNFNKPPELITSNYKSSEMYRAYKKGKTGGASLSKLKNQVENKIREFAKKEGKDFIILGQRTSEAPYLFGNYPRVEIIFVLAEKN